MSFNMQKYDEVRFHSDELTHKRIKVLLLWFEYEVYKRNLTPEQQFLLIDRWIDKIVGQEYYEVVPFFKNMRTDMLNNKLVTLTEEKEDNDNVAEEPIKESFLTMCWNKIKKIFTN